MLDPLPLVLAQVLLDLGLVVGGFVDGDADLAAGGRHGAGMQPGQLAFDVEVANFPEVADPLVEVGPDVHVAAMDVVGQVIDLVEPRIHLGHARLPVGVEDKIHVIDGALLAVAVDKGEGALADAVDGGDVELHGPYLADEGFGPLGDGVLLGTARIRHPKCHAADAGPVQAGKLLRLGVGLGVDHEIDVPLAVEPALLVLVSGHLRKPQGDEQRLEGGNALEIRGSVLDEFEPIGAEGIDGMGTGRRGRHDALLAMD